MVGELQIKRVLRALGLLFVVACYIPFSFQNAYGASGITYTGRIFKGDQPLDSGVVRFDVWVKTKDNCVLYYERRNIDMTGSSGTYSFEIGDANIVPGSQSFPQTGIQTIGDLFNNAKSRANGDVDTSLPCSTFNPASDEGRLMTVSFTPQGETAQALPDLAITAVPTAFQAFNANKVNGYGTGDLLKVDSSVNKTTYANNALSQAQYDEFWKLILGTSTTYLKAIPTLGGDVTGTLPAMTVVKIQNVAVTAPTTGDTGKVLTYNGTGMVWSAAAAGGITSLNGETGTTQSFAVGNSGTDFNISSSSGTHTFNIPTASSSNRGLLTSSDWTTFNSKQSSALGSGQVWIGNASNGAQAQTLSGDATVSASGNVLVDKTQSAQASKILQLDSSGNAYVAGIDIKGSSATAKLRFTGSTDMVMNLPTTSGTANQFLQTDGAGNLSWGSQSAMLPTISAGQVWVGNASNGAQAFSLTGDIASVSSTGVVTLSSSATGSNKLPLAGGTMSGAINMGGNNITNAGDVSLAAGKFLGLGVGSTAGTVAGQIWYDSGVIKYFDGTSAQTLGVSGSGITSLNGLTSGTQSFVNGTSGTAPAFSSAGSAHTLNIPMASSATVTAGLISNADYASMMAKQSNTLAAGQVWVGNASGAAEAFALSGDISSVSNTGSVTVNKTTTGQANYILALDGSGVANVKGLDVQTGTGKVTLLTSGAFTNYTLTLPNASPSANQIMKSDASGNLSWVTYLANVSDSAPLTNGKMWIGNASGIASEVTMSGDATITNAGLLSLKNIGTAGTYTKVITDAQGRVMSGSALASGDVTAALGYTPTAAGSGYVNGGNSFAGNATIGLNDAYDLGVKTNGATRMTVSGAGNVGIGTTSPTNKLHVDGGTSAAENRVALFESTVTGMYNGNAVVLNQKQSGSAKNAIIFQGNGTDRWAITNDVTASDSQTFTIYDSVASDSRLTINSLGYLGTGTSWNDTFSNQLTVKGNASIGSGYIGNAAPANGLLVQGKVGIATTSPSVTLDVGSATDAIRLPNGTTAQRPANSKGHIRYNTTSDTVEYNDGSAWVTVGSSLGYTPVNKAGDTMSGDLTTQNLNIAAGKFLGLGAGSTAGTVAGQIWYDSGVIKYFDGTTTQSLGVAGAGITSLNGLTSNTQSFVNGTSGTAPAFSSAGSAHTLNIPMASSATVTAGLISNADYSSMMAKQSNSLAAGQMWVGNASGVAQAFTLSGDVASVSNAGLVTVNKTTTGQSNYIMALDGSGIANAYGVGVKGTTSGTVTLQSAATTANYSLTFPAVAPANNQILQSDGSGILSWVSNAANVNNASSLAAGKMWIGNASGIAVEQTMSGDATITNEGLLTLKSVGTVGTYWKVVTDAQGRVTSGSALASGDVTTALGYTPTAAGSGYVNGGNAFGANATIGLTDNFNLGFKTNNSTRMTIDNAGNVGIGTTTPNAVVEIKGPSGGVGGDSLRISNPGGQTYFYAFSTADTSANIGAWSSAGSERPLIINEGGTANVGIGSASAGSMLSVNGNAAFGSYAASAAPANSIIVSGKVGIGTTSPSVALDVGSKTDAIRIPAGNTSQRPANAAGLLRWNTTNSNVEYNDGSGWNAVATSSGSSGAYINGGNTFAGNATIGLNDAYNLGFKTNNTTKMTLTTDGKLGIGTTTPNTALAIASGDITLDAGYSMMWGQSAYSFINGDSGPSSHLILGTSGAIVMTLDVNGNVGIGTNPAFTLDMGSRTDAVRLPQGTTGEQPANTKGLIRFNTTSNTVEYNNGSAWVTVGSSLGYTPVNKAGDTMSGDLNTQNLNIAAGKYLGLGAGSTAGTVAGQMWYDSGVIKYFDGTSAKSLGIAGSGITSLNGLTSNTQSFVMGTSGTAPAFNSASSAHTLNIPMASAASVTAGLLSNADYTSMMAKQSSSLAAGQMWVGNASGAAQAFALSGDISSVSNTGSVTVNKTTTGTSSTILALDGSGVANAYGLGVKGTTSGTVTLQAAAATSNYSLKLPSTTPTANQVMQSDASGNLSWVTALTSSTGFINGGNTFAGNATIGLNDAYTLGFKTNNATQMTLTAAGRLGIGTATPSGTLEVQGGTAAAGVTGVPITLKAQNGGSGGAVGGSIFLTPGDGTSGWPGGTVVIATTGGQNGALSVTNDKTNSYASTAASTSPSYAFRMTNSYNQNGNTALVNGNVKNSSALFQEGYMGFVSVTGASNYSPDYVVGLQSGSNSYQERLRINGSTGNVGIGTSSPAATLDVVGSAAFENNAVSTAAANFSFWKSRNYAAVQLNDNLGFFSYYGSDGSSQQRSAYISSTVDDTVATNSVPANLVFATTQAGGTDSTERMRITSGGNVGINTTPTGNAKLEVSGAIVSVGRSVASGATVNLAQGNTTVLASVGGSAITLQNMVNGGNYTLVITDTTSRTYTFTGCNSSKYSPANQATINGTPSVYNILTIYNGASYDCYITWSTGFQ